MNYKNFEFYKVRAVSLHCIQSFRVYFSLCRGSTTLGITQKILTLNRTDTNRLKVQMNTDIPNKEAVKVILVLQVQSLNCERRRYRRRYSRSCNRMRRCLVCPLISIQLRLDVLCLTTGGKSSSLTPQH